MPFQLIGDLSRDQLSSLMITNLGTASDIVDFYSILDESQAMIEDNNIDLVYIVLVFWAWSLMQVCAFILCLTYLLLRWWISSTMAMAMSLFFWITY